MNKKEQEINKKEQELQNNTREINYLKLQNKLLKKVLDDSKKFNDSKNKENNELRNEIEKLKEEKVQGSSIIGNFKKLYKAPSTVPKILQDVRKRDNKARTFAPPDSDDEMKKLAELTEAKMKTPDVLLKRTFTRIKRPEDLERDKFFKYINKFEDINLNDVNNLTDEIKKISKKVIMF